MENASKALLIAAGVLVGIIIISIFVYEMSYVANTSRVYDEQMAQTAVLEFNANIEVYTNKQLKAQEVVTLWNYINEWNYGGEMSEGHPTDIIEINWIPSGIMGLSSRGFFTDKTIEEFIMNYPEDEYYFECTNLEYRNTRTDAMGRIYEFTIIAHKIY